MAYKLLYVEDQRSDSRASDLRNLGYEVNTFDPSSNIRELLEVITSDIDALILDYRLTKGVHNACFDAPTIAQTIRSKHSETYSKIPIILMSNETVITDYYNDFTSQDLFDFALSKQEFNQNQECFDKDLKSFLSAYRKIKEFGFDVLKILGLKEIDAPLVDSQINIKLKHKTIEQDIFAHSFFIYHKVVGSTGALISEDILCARLGISKEQSSSLDLEKLYEVLKETSYTGIFADIRPRWWMKKIDKWWKDTLMIETPLRRLSALERIDILKEKLSLENLVAAEIRQFQESTNFWTACVESGYPLDPFDGIEIIRNYSSWQEKEYLSIESAMTKLDKYKKRISKVDIKSIIDLGTNLRNNG